MLKKSKLQVNLFDGRNIIVKAKDIKVGDSVLLSLPKQKLEKVLKLEKGAYAFMIKGGHVGETGIVEEITKNSIKIKSKNSVFETTKDSVFVLGKSKPEIKID